MLPWEFTGFYVAEFIQVTSGGSILIPSLTGCKPIVFQKAGLQNHQELACVEGWKVSSDPRLSASSNTFVESQAAPSRFVDIKSSNEMALSCTINSPTGKKMTSSLNWSPSEVGMHTITINLNGVDVTFAPISVNVKVTRLTKINSIQVTGK